jgi:hypothetical protein
MSSQRLAPQLYEDLPRHLHAAKAHAPPRLHTLHSKDPFAHLKCCTLCLQHRICPKVVPPTPVLQLRLITASILKSDGPGIFCIVYCKPTSQATIAYRFSVRLCVMTGWCPNQPQQKRKCKMPSYITPLGKIFTNATCSAPHNHLPHQLGRFLSYQRQCTVI